MASLHVALLLVVVACISYCSAQNGKYDGHQIAWVFPSSLEDEVIIKGLENAGLLEWWNEDNRNGPLDMLTLHLKPGGLDALRYMNVGQKVLVEELEDMILKEKIQADLSRERGEDVFERFLNFDEILSHLDSMAKECGERCTLSDIGTTTEGRPMRLLKITGKASAEPKKGVWIDAGIHAREWISPTTNLYLLTRLIEDYGTDPEATALADAYDWYFLPVINADGYVYTWTQDRLWRKSRKAHSADSDIDCVGTDLNRNFDFQWETVGASKDPCSNTYAGPQPFSDPESSAVSDFLLHQNVSWELFISLHSKGQLFMAPWGFTDKPPPNIENMEKAGIAGVNAIHDTHGETYIFGSATTILYPSSGTSRDWAAGAAHIPYVYTIELRDTGEHGWILPPNNVRPTGEEIWAGLKAVIRTIQELQ